MSTPGCVAVIGGSLGGLTTAEGMRRLGYDGVISLVSEELHDPYDRPPLSKQILAGKWEPASAMLRQPEQLEALGLDFRRGVRATGVDIDHRVVTLSDGEAIRYDALVVATGLRPRWLPMFRGMAGVHVLRTLDDTLALQSDLTPERQVLVVGAGFLGTEIAATARQLGASVTLVDVVTEPLTLQLGPEIGQLVKDLHQSRGVDVRAGVGVRDVRSTDGRVSGVVLSDGTQLETDLVVLAIGAEPAVEWLEGSGLDLTGGLVCDATNQAGPGVYAVGDVARWPHEKVSTLLRVESRTNAVDQALAVAHNVLNPETPETYCPILYGWTDQYDVKLQVHGQRTPIAEFCLVEGSPEANKFVGAFRHQGKVTGIVGWNSARAMRDYRQKVFTDADPTWEPYRSDQHRDDDQALAGLG